MINGTKSQGNRYTQQNSPLHNMEQFRVHFCIQIIKYLSIGAKKKCTGAKKKFTVLSRFKI
jgi:hypothetical protein